MTEEVFEIRLKPQGETLRRYMLSRKRCCFIMGPLGSAKTYQSCQKIFKLMVTQRANAQGERKSRWIAVRNTYSDLLTTTVKDWMDLFGDLGRYKGPGAEPPTHHLRFRLEDNTVVVAELIFLALDRPEHVKKLRGTQVTGFWLNEVKELEKAIIDMCDGRHGRYPSPMDGGPSWHGIIGDTNACDDDHWYYELAEERAKNPDAGMDEWEFLRQPGGVQWDEEAERWIPNPAAENLNNLPDGYYTKQIAGKDWDWINVNLANNYGSVATGKPIYKGQWNDQLHVSKYELLPLPKRPLVIGMDFGLQPSAVFLQETVRGQVRGLEELIADNMGVRQFAENVLIPTMSQKYKGLDYVIVGDPAGDQRSDTDETSVFDELRDLGLKAEGSPDRSNSAKRRWEAVRFYLNRLIDGKPAFLLSPTCKVVRKGFNGGYQYRRMQVAGSPRYSKEADKNKFSHPHDAVQYGCLYIRGDIYKEDVPKATVLEARSY